jgi:type I restriction enzyme R subunit
VAFSGEYNYHGVKVDEYKLNRFPSSQIEKTVRSGMYRFLIVADKFQTGYDEPLLHTMYVDKPLHGLQTVQTLSRLNRICPKKDDTSVLDFVNTTEEVEEAFQTFFKTTMLSRETDPNKLNDLLSTIEQYDIYTENEVELLNQKFWSNVSREEIDPLLDTMKERFCALDDEGKVECKSAIKAFIRTYEFLSTIMPFGSLEWEKKETVFTLLIHKLPSLGMDDLTRGLLEAVDFDRYRLEKREERDIQLQNTNSEIAPVPTFTSTSVAEPDMQHLSTIETQFNELFGNIEWADNEVVRKQVTEIAERVAEDDTVRNSMLNSDDETANQDCDQSTASQMAIMTATHTELMKVYWQRADFRESLNQMIREKVRNSINPPYDESALKQKMREEFRNDFADFCDGEHYVEFNEVIDIFFRLINADTIADLQGLRGILRRILNCLYRAQHREEDFRTWYADLVSRFEAFLKKIYWVKEGTAMPLNADGREPALRETVSYFPKVESLYHARNPKYDMFKQFYRVVYDWRNNENHRALEIPAEMLPVGLHAAVALYLYTTMVYADNIKDKV